mmetsp:Transcript_64468/g.145394  ORF Transcript_64468/g.145394 Transcript_64468/m.145394 type:complete len:447 (-) Transcript_64468:614-1954(-)
MLACRPAWTGRHGLGRKRGRKASLSRRRLFLARLGAERSKGSRRCGRSGMRWRRSRCRAASTSTASSPRCLAGMARPPRPEKGPRGCGTRCGFCSASRATWPLLGPASRLRGHEPGISAPALPPQALARSLRSGWTAGCCRGGFACRAVSSRRRRGRGPGSARECQLLWKKGAARAYGVVAALGEARSGRWHLAPWRRWRQLKTRAAWGRPPRQPLRRWRQRGIRLPRGCKRARRSLRRACGGPRTGGSSSPREGCWPWRSSAAAPSISRSAAACSRCFWARPSLRRTWPASIRPCSSTGFSPCSSRGASRPWRQSPAVRSSLWPPQLRKLTTRHFFPRPPVPPPVGQQELARRAAHLTSLSRAGARNESRSKTSGGTCASSWSIFWWATAAGSSATSPRASTTSFRAPSSGVSNPPPKPRPVLGGRRRLAPAAAAAVRMWLTLGG